VERMLQKRAAARWAGADGLLANLDHWVVPSDWRQWEAAHKRRRDAARTARAEQRTAVDASSPSDLATIRFRRPTPAVGASNVRVIERGAVPPPTPAAAGVTIEDDKPSWAVESVVAPRGRRFAALGAALAVVTLTGAVWYASATGRINLERLGQGSAARTVASAGAGNDVARVRPPSVTDTQVGTLGDSAMATDSAERSPDGAPSTLGSSAGDQQASTPVPVIPTDSAAPRPRVRRPVATNLDTAVPPAIAAPLVRATDDPSVVTVGGRHSCALADGKALCWGANDDGQLGDGNLESRDVPSAVVGDLVFVHLTAGLAHTCGLTRGGEAYCWGADDRGQLGDATTTSRSAPVRVNSNLSFRIVRAGSNHTCGLTTGGEIACWGANNAGQLGDGSSGMRSSPVRVSTDQRFVSLSTGWNHSCGIAYDGAVWCWGSNSDGQLGDGARANRATPERVAATVRFTSAAAGGNHTCAVGENGDAYCWGRNAFGQLGIGGTTSQASPTRVETSARFTSVSVGGVHSCARTTGGQAWCWGRNTYGQLGDGTMVNRDAPVRVIGGNSFAVVSATGAHTCGTTADGTVSCWGYNVQGQLGDGTRNHLPRPTRVAIPGR